MQLKKIESAFEALLFAGGDALSVDKAAEILEVDVEDLQRILTDYVERYNAESRGLKILKLDNKYQLTTRSEFAPYIQRIVEPKKRNPLSRASLEVLAIISYKQPVTRATIEHIRGVNCDYPVSRLAELGLIEEVGKLDAPGRPTLFGTTDEFLRCFGISSIKELPLLEEYDIDEALIAAEMAQEEEE